MMQKIFSKIFILIFFFLLSGLNIYLIIKSYYQIKKETMTQKILYELEKIKNGQEQFIFSGKSKVLGEVTTEVKLSDARVANLKNFFRKYNSPLYDYAEKIVYTSDKYGFDYRLLPAIAMQESNLCKYIPEESHNCWGYGIYGNQVIKFSSYEEAIEVVAKGIKKNYLDKGLTTPELVMKKYTPSSSGSWAKGVNYFFRLLE